MLWLRKFSTTLTRHADWKGRDENCWRDVNLGGFRRGPSGEGEKKIYKIDRGRGLGYDI